MRRKFPSSLVSIIIKIREKFEKNVQKKCNFCQSQPLHQSLKLDLPLDYRCMQTIVGQVDRRSTLAHGSFFTFPLSPLHTRAKMHVAYRRPSRPQGRHWPTFPLFLSTQPIYDYGKDVCSLSQAKSPPRATLAHCSLFSIGEKLFN